MTEETIPQEVWDKLTDDQKLCATIVVFDAIKSHINEGGTYRYLIYDRLGFKPDAYINLLSSGMYISNFIHNARKQNED